jgi:hypothetical protein
MSLKVESPNLIESLTIEPVILEPRTFTRGNPTNLDAGISPKLFFIDERIFASPVRIGITNNLSILVDPQNHRFFIPKDAIGFSFSDAVKIKDDYPDIDGLLCYTYKPQGEGEVDEQPLISINNNPLLRRYFGPIRVRGNLVYSSS